MKYFLIFSLPLLSSCFTLPDKKEIEEKLKELKNISWTNDYTYIDSKDTMQVLLSGADKSPLEKNTSITLLSGDTSLHTVTGKYVNYLKEGGWRYQTGKIASLTITYSKYAIGKFIITNLPERGTTAIIDNKTEKYTLPVKEDSITILFHADTLSARIKRRPYEELIVEQLQEKGFKLSSAENKLLQDSSNVISISSMKFVKGTERLLYKTAYAVMKNGYLAYAMQYDPKNQHAAELLFDGVLTNLFLNEERFYYPFKKNETTSSIEEDSTVAE